MHQINQFLKNCLFDLYVNWFSFQFIVLCDYWLSHVVVEIDTNLCLGDPWISSGCFLPWTYSNNNTSNLFHLIFQESIDCVCDTSKRKYRYISKFLVILTYFFYVISVSKKLTLFRRTFSGVTSMSEISASFQCTFFNLISRDEKSTLFRCIFWRNLDGKLM